MGCSAHRAVLARCIDRGSCPFSWCHMGGGPARQLEFRVTRLVAAGDAIATLGADPAIGVDEDRTKWFIAGIECLFSELDTAAQIFVFAFPYQCASLAELCAQCRRCAGIAG